MAFARQSLAIAPVSSLQDPWPWMWHDLTNNNIKRLKHISFHVWKQIETCTFCRLQPHLHLSTSIYIFQFVRRHSVSTCFDMFQHVSVSRCQDFQCVSSFRAMAMLSSGTKCTSSLVHDTGIVGFLDPSERLLNVSYQWWSYERLT